MMADPYSEDTSSIRKHISDLLLMGKGYEMGEALEAGLTASENRKQYLHQIEFELLSSHSYQADQFAVLRVSSGWKVASRWLEQKLAEEQSFKSSQASSNNSIRILEAEEVEFEEVADNAQIKPSTSFNASEYLTQKQAVQYLKLSRPTLLKLRVEGRLVVYKPSANRVLYRKSELDAYLDEKKGTPHLR